MIGMWEFLGWVGVGCVALVLLAVAAGLAITIVKAALSSSRSGKTSTTSVYRGGE